MSSDTSPRGRETVTAFFESRAEAEMALDRLRQAGFAADDARIYEGRAAGPDAEREDRHKGFWETLGDLFLPHEDRGTYAEGLSRGGTLLSVPVRPDERSRVVDILDDDGTIDLDERQEVWRSEGWGGPPTSPSLGGPASSALRSGETGLDASTPDVSLRSGISGIGAKPAGAPVAGVARRGEGSAGRRTRIYRFDEPADAAPGPSDTDRDEARLLEEGGGSTDIANRLPL
jgi:hypothetical protein